MAGRRYETFLQVLKNISQVCAVNTRTENIISFLQAAINFLFIVIFTNEIPKQFTVILFAAKGMIYLLCSHIKGDLFTYEDNIIFSRVKISCFHVKPHLVFFIDVYLIKYLS